MRALTRIGNADSFNFLASLINGNPVKFCEVNKPHHAFNFLASLINGNTKNTASKNSGYSSFNFLASLINGNADSLLRVLFLLLTS